MDRNREQEDAGQLLRGREACERHAWETAYTALAAADRSSVLTPPDLDSFARAAFLSGHDREALDIWTRAHHSYLREGRPEAAVRCAFWLAFFYRHRQDLAQSSGWLARGRRLLDRGSNVAEQGYLLLLEALDYYWEGAPERAYAMFEECLAIGSRFDDTDLAILGRMSIGDSLVQRGEISRGMALLDEVMAAVIAGEVSPILVGIVYCAVIAACHRSFDLRRGNEWTEAFTAWCESQPELVPYRGECVVFRSEIMQVQGAWRRAMEEIVRITDTFSESRFLPWAGDAFYQQAELHRLRGDFAEAETAYRRAGQHGNILQPGLALLRLAQGRTEAAAAMISRLLGEAKDDLRRIRLLPAHVEIMIADGALDAAEASTQELAARAFSQGGRFVQALAGQAAGALALARERPAEALPPLRGALDCWLGLGAPFDAARTRVLISLACRALEDLDSAGIELDSARETFTRLGAKPEIERLEAIMGSGGSAGPGGLTDREIEVLRLVATGRSNREIAEALVVSEHTIRRHLQNIFARLGVSSRAAATAFAYQHNLV